MVTHLSYLNELQQIEHAQSFDFKSTLICMYACVSPLLQGLLNKEMR